MDPSFYDLYALGDEPSALEKQKAIADALRGRISQQQQLGNMAQARASMGAISGHPALQGLGRTQQTYANQLAEQNAGQERLLAQAGEIAAGAKGRAQDRLLRRAELRQRELDRQANKFIIIQGADGGQYFVDPTNPRAKAVPVTDEAGELLRKPGGGSKQVTAGEAAQIGTYDTAAAAMDELGKSWDKDVGAFSGVTQYLPGTDARQYGNKADVAAQVIGGILEEGKLGEADLPRYKAMMPQPGDSKETKEKKVQAVNQMIGLKRRGKIQGLGQAGYDISGFPMEQAAPSSEAPTAELAPPGMKWQRNKKTGERRLVPSGG